MKRLWILLLAALLLAGCKNQPPQGNTEPADVIEATGGLYVPDSAAEQGTDGAVRMYNLPEDTYLDITGIGANVLTVGKKGLTLLTGAQAEVVAVLNSKNISALDTYVTGVAYYAAESRQVYVLNAQLQIVTQLALPETVVGDPVISLEKYEVYYSTGSEIRALNMNTGISRLLRKHTVANQALVDAYFSGEVLLCRFVNEAGVAQRTYISTETGQTLNGGSDISNLQTNGADYFANWQDGTVRQAVFGVKGGQVQRFLAPAIPEGKVGGRVALPVMHGIVDYIVTDAGLELSYYDLNTGRKTSQVVVADMALPAKIHSDGTNIWILTTTSGNALYRWEISKTPVADETVYTGVLYTEDNPDEQGLAESRKLADTYQGKYGIKVQLWKNAVAHTGGYVVKPEHKPEVINGILEAIQPALEQFPEKFLVKTVERGWIQIAIVQSIEGDRDWVQFWEDGDCWILLSAKCNAADALIQGISYGIDSHVLGNSRKFDSWNKLNPEDFAYSYSDKVEANPEYLEGKTRAFTDKIAMTYPLEDRCRVFYNAMLPDNKEMFSSPVMQEKLLRICAAIREAYGLEKNSETYPWEQYLLAFK